jgi:hypothetical protein
MAMLLGAMFVFGTRLNDHRKALAFLNQKWTIFLSTHTAIPALLLDLRLATSSARETCSLDDVMAFRCSRLLALARHYC